MATSDELELLTSMYLPEEIVVGGDRIIFRARPSGSVDEDNRMLIVAHLRTPAGYPDAKPAVADLVITRGLSETQIRSLTAHLEDVASQCQASGEGSLFQLTSALKEFLDTAALPNCVICYGDLKELATTVTLPGCLHSFDSPCLFPWWSVRMDEHISSPAEVAKREALKGKEGNLAWLAETSAAAVAALEEKIATLPARIEQAKRDLDMAEQAKAEIMSPTAAPSGAGTSSAPAGKDKAAGKRGGKDKATATPAPAPAPVPETPELSLADAKANVKQCEGLLWRLEADLKAAQQDIAGARNKAAAAAATASSGGGGAGGSDAELPTQVLICPVCRSGLLAKDRAAAASAAPTAAGEEAAAKTKGDKRKAALPSIAPSAGFAGSADWLGREPSAIAAQESRVLDAFKAWLKLQSSKTGTRLAASKVATQTAAVTAPETAASSGADGETWDHSDPSVCDYVRRTQERHKAILERQTKNCGLITVGAGADAPPALETTPVTAKAPAAAAVSAPASASAGKGGKRR